MGDETLKGQVAMERPKSVVVLLQALDVHKKEKHSPSGPPPSFELAFCYRHKTATVIQAREFVGEGKTAQLCLQHVLFCGTTDRAHQKLTDLRTPHVTKQRAVSLRTYIPQQTGKFSICVRKESMQNVIDGSVFSAGQRARGSAAKSR